MRLGPLWLPLRFQMIAIPGQAFVRRMQITWFALLVFKGVDTYINSEGEMKVGNTVVCGPEIDQGANLALWAEALSTPSALVADPRVRWEPIDDRTARLIVPCGSGSDHLLVHFDPQTGLIRETTADRFRTPGQPKEPWKVELGDYKTVHGACIATKVAITWERDGRPWSVWSVWSVEGVEYNVDVAGLLRAPATSVASRTITAR
jgi:hypothetical protein